MTRQVATRDDDVAVEIVAVDGHVDLLEDGRVVGTFDSMAAARRAAGERQEQQAVTARGQISVTKYGVNRLRWRTV